MSDEQTIYISPEDDLTTVRERLEQISARRLTMVIPPQTQLRSHVAWKLLYARARELGKEVVIVSSDPQVRSVAHAVKFKVAHSLETSPATGKPRPTSRPGRASNSGGVKTRTSTPLSSRPSSAKDSSEPRSTYNQRGTSNTRIPRTRKSESEWHKDPQSHQSTEFEDIGTFSEETITGEIPHPLAYDASEKQYSQSYDFRIHPTPTIHPLSDQIEDPDLLLEDYTQAQDILSAAREGQKRFTETGIAPDTRPEEALPSSGPTEQPDTTTNPLTDMEDSQAPQTDKNGVVAAHTEDEAGWIYSQARQTEPSDAISLEGIDTNEHLIQNIEDVEDLPDSIINNTIEYRGDKDDIVPPPSLKPITYTDPEQATNDAEQENFPSRSYGVRSRRKSSNLSSNPPTPSSAASAWQLDDDALPPIEERQMHPKSSVPLQPRMSGARPAGKLSPNPATSPRSRTSTGRGQQTPIRSTTRPIQQRPGPRATRTSIGTKQHATRDKAPRKALVAIVIAILLLFAVYLLVYYGPTANITVGIATQDYSQPVTLTAKVDSKQAQDIQAQQFSKDFTKSGSGTATGSQDVGTNPAQGIVIFTYNGSNPNGIIIPDGSIITTSGDNPTQFATTAEVLVPPSNQNKVLPPVSIQAVKPGKDGNVDAGAITVIPNNTLNSISQAQSTPIAVSDLNLSVVNEDPTTGGGAKPTPVVTNQDLTNVKNSLHQQLQGEINTWLQQLSNTGAVSTPQTTDGTLINAPKVNDIEAKGTFAATIKVTTTVLLVHTADLQKGAIKQLNDAIKNNKSYAGDSILTDINPAVTINQLKQVNADANSITFTFNATAKAGPRLITKEYVQQLAMGKSISDARTTLMNIPKVKTVDITVSPDFMPWVSHWDGHVNITIYPIVKAAAH